MNIVGFENVDDVNDLLERIGITESLGEFLARHLTDVLRKQYSSIVIESIELVVVHDCSAGGMPTSQPSIIELDSLLIPVDTRALVRSDAEVYQLDLHVRIKAEKQDEIFDIETDVLVQDQAKIMENGS